MSKDQPVTQPPASKTVLIEAFDEVLEGYAMVAPDPIDEQVAKESICGRCGKVGLTAFGYRKGSSYVVLGRCENPECKHAIEF